MIAESFKQACPHCQGDGVDVAFEHRYLTIGSMVSMVQVPVVAECGFCKGSGIVEVDMLVKAEWVFPEMLQKEFTL